MIRLALFDLDGTLTPHRSSWQYLHEYFGTWSAYGETWQRRFFAGEISYREWCQHDVRPWIGKTEDELTQAVAGLSLREGAVQCVAGLQAAGIEVVVLSMGLHFVVEPLARQLGVSQFIANELRFREGRFEGEVRIHVGWGEKGAVARRLMAARALRPEQVLALGDSESDLSMFEAAGRAIAVHPRDDKTAAAADVVLTGSLEEVVGLVVVGEDTGVGSSEFHIGKRVSIQ